MSWQKILAQGFTSVSELLSFLELPTNLGDIPAEQLFATRVPLGFAQRMHKGNPADPLLLQVLAQIKEHEKISSFTTDPLKEHNTSVKGLIHKYSGRVLITLTGVCAINCRFCFRRHFPYQEQNPGRQDYGAICSYIAQNCDIHEVILSGGDPLLASNHRLKAFISQLEQIPHLKTLRFHTRIPVVLPERIDEGFIELLEGTQLHKVMVLHTNHPQELNASVHTACDQLRHAGCHLLNQSVLLAKINDDASILADLSHGLFACRVLPYYLHVLDKVAGAAHFDLPFSKAQSIYQQLQHQLPGYLVPRLVREEAGKLSKTLLTACSP